MDERGSAPHSLPRAAADRHPAPSPSTEAHHRRPVAPRLAIGHVPDPVAVAAPVRRSRLDSARCAPGMRRRAALPRLVDPRPHRAPRRLPRRAAPRRRSGRPTRRPRRGDARTGAGPPRVALANHVRGPGVRARRPRRRPGPPDHRAPRVPAVSPARGRPRVEPTERTSGRRSGRCCARRRWPGLPGCSCSS